MTLKFFPASPAVTNAAARDPDATSALMLELAQLGRVFVSGGIGGFGGAADKWHASLEIATPGAGELRFTNPGYASTPLRALHDLKERVNEYMNHGGRR